MSSKAFADRMLAGGIPRAYTVAERVAFTLREELKAEAVTETEILLTDVELSQHRLESVVRAAMHIQRRTYTLTTDPLLQKAWRINIGART